MRRDKEEHRCIKVNHQAIINLSGSEYMTGWVRANADFKASSLLPLAQRNRGYRLCRYVYSADLRIA